MKGIFSVILFFTLLHPSLIGQVVINEYSCSNLNGPTDSFGEREDWVEFYNNSAAPYNLAGCFLSDKNSNINKWQIPSGTIPAFGRTVVFFSGKDGVFSGEIHTKFGLTQTKNEWIILTEASGNILDSLKIIKVTKPNHSYGRLSDGSNNWGIFLSPSFGNSNINGIDYYAPKPTFSINPGFYSGTQSISITTTFPNSNIYYTLDGSTPSQSSILYTGPISINLSTVIRAISVPLNTNIPSSFVETNSYIISSTHTMPVLSVSGDLVEDFLNDIAPGSFSANFDGAFEYFDENQILVSEGDGHFNKHGNDSWAYAQRGFDFIMKDQMGYDYAIRHQIFQNKSRNKFKKIIVKAAANDNYPFADGAHIRDAYVHTLSQLGGLKIDERTSLFCVVYVNGQYWGVYDIREKVDDRDFTDYYYDQDKLDFLKTWGATWAEYGDMVHWNNLFTYITSNNLAISSNYNYVDSLYNTGSLIDYVVLNSYTVCTDWLNWNTAWWHGHNQNGDKKKFRYALWDMDATFGHYINYTGLPSTDPDADPCNPESLAGTSSDPQGHITILNALMANPQFEQAYISRYIDLSNGIFSCVEMQAILDSMVDVIRPEMQNQINRWGGTFSQWEANVQEMKDFIDQRCAALSTGLIDCYDLVGPYSISVDVQPPGAGKVKVNSLWLPNYIWQGTFFGNIDTYFKASANTGFEFDHWESNNHVFIYPDSLTDTLNFINNDTIIAFFTEKIVTPPIDTTENPGPGPEPPEKTFDGFHLPTGLSPNNDGNNDVLEFYVGDDVVSFDLAIYDRWGAIIFQTKIEDVFWDGTVNGNLLNNGVYAYSLRYTLSTGQEVKKTGNITLIR